MGNRAPRKTKVLFINTAEFFGPVMQVHSHILRHLDRHAVQTIVATNSRGDSSARLSSLGDIQVKKYNLGGTMATEKSGLLPKLAALLISLTAVFSVLKIAAFALRERVAVIHSASGPRMILLGTALSLLTGAKLVVHVHERPPVRRGPKRLLISWGLHRARAIITVSQYIKNEVARLGVDSEKIWPALNVVDLHRFNPSIDGSRVREQHKISPTTPLVVAVGRITPQKGQQDLLQAMVTVRQAVPDAKALVVGWAREIRMPSGLTFWEELQQFCKHHNLGGEVIFPGPRTDIPEVFAAADVIVIPSRYNDPCPLVVLEAMATGKAVVGTRTGGIPEMLSDDTGELVPPADPVAMAEAITRLVKDPALRQKLGLAARRRVEEHFYESRLAEDVTKVYWAVTKMSLLASSCSRDA